MKANTYNIVIDHHDRNWWNCLKSVIARECQKEEGGRLELWEDGNIFNYLISSLRDAETPEDLKEIMENIKKADELYSKRYP
jgi:hypothetical protein